MLIGEPPRSQADLNFQIFGIPVRVHPFFWVVALLLVIGGGEKLDPTKALVWLGTFFVSILVHELGHAFAFRRYGGQPWITLYGLGGLASSTQTPQAPGSRIFISAAGPAAGFALAAVVFVAVWLSGHEVGFIPSTSRLDWQALGIDSAIRQPLAFLDVYFRPYEAEGLNILVGSLFFVNIMWGIINLFPIYPLDGGQIAREVLVERDPYEGIRQSLWLSIFAAGGLAVYALSRGSIFMTLLFGYLGYTSYATLQSYSGRGGQRW